jgi:dienelactone hydrolase
VGAPKKYSLVEFTTPRGLKVKALFQTPSNSKKPYAAILYHHGRLIHDIDYERSARAGYDIRGFVAQLAWDGYAVLAPLRRENTSDAFLKDLNEGSIRYLKSRGDIDPSRLGLVGFSLGGNPAYVGASQCEEFRAAAMISPVIHDRFLTPENAAKVKAPMLILYGAKDFTKVLHTCENSIVPILKQQGHRFHARVQYDVEHKWFMTVRPEFWDQIRAFLYRFLPPNEAPKEPSRA